jgi:ABC-type lipoprotein release transport system permease subunit
VSERVAHLHTHSPAPLVRRIGGFMRFVIRFALKNIWRYKRRTIITFAAISFGIAVFVFMDSMLKGFHYESVRNFIDYESGHLKIYNREFYEEMEDEGFLLLDKGIDNYEDVQKLINRDDVSAAPRIAFRARLVNEEIGGDRPFTVIGIDPEKDRDVYNLPDAILSGRFLEPGENGLIMGRMGAEKMEAELGDTLTILTRTKNDTYQAISADVVGILDPPNPTINRTFAYIPLDIADADLQMEGSVTEIGIRAGSDDVDDLLHELMDRLTNSNLSQLQVVSWEELGKDWLTLSKTKTVGSYTIILVVFAIAAVGIINTMLMSVFERVQEIGMMRALGMSDREVLWSFVFEGGAIGFFGAVLGVFIGFVLNCYQIYHGFDWSVFADTDIGYRIMNVVKGVWNPGAFIFAFLFSIIVPALISIYPSRKAIKMEITQALRTT